MTEAAIAIRGPNVAMNPWLVAAAVVVPTFMEVLDTTIAVVALRYIAGGLSATVNDGEWVLTSYLAANAIILPITGWLSNRFGRRNYFLASIAVFTVASGLCGMATSLSQLDSVPRNPRPGRGRAAAEQPGSSARCVPAREARGRNDPVCLGCVDRAGRRSDPRRMDYGQLFVAVGLLHQLSGWPSGLRRLLRRRP